MARTISGLDFHLSSLRFPILGNLWTKILFDMLRTSVNVTEDMTACVEMERLVGDPPPEDESEFVAGGLLPPA